MDDIRISASFPVSPKIKKLHKRLGADGPLHLIYLWIFAAQSGRTDGVLVNMDEDDIELAVNWTGEDGQFVRTLISLRLLNQDDSGLYYINDWEEHQPWVSGHKERSIAAKKAAIKRHHGEEAAEEFERKARAEHAEGMRAACAEDAGCMRGAQGDHAAGNAPSPSPSPLPPPSPKSPVTGVDLGKYRDLVRGKGVAS